MKKYISIFVCIIFICILSAGCNKDYKSSQEPSMKPNVSSKPIRVTSNTNGNKENTLQPEVSLPIPSPMSTDIKYPVTDSKDNNISSLPHSDKLLKYNVSIIDGEVHLNYYDLFKEYNEEHTFGNLNISEAWIKNKPYYQFTKGKIKVLCDSWGKNWFVDNGTIKKEISYKSDRFFVDAHCGMSLDLKDCLSTGKDQLIIINALSSYGTERESIHIYNIHTLKEYKLEDYSKKLDDFINMKVVSLNKNEVTLKLNCSDGTEYVIKEQPTYNKKSDYKINFNYFNSFDISKEGKLFVSHTVNSDPNTPIGKVTGELIYDGCKIVLKENTLKFLRNSD